MTPLQTELQAFLQASQIEYTSPADGVTVKTLSQWLSVQDAGTLSAAINDLALGAANGFTVPAGNVDSSIVKGAVAPSEAMSMQNSGVLSTFIAWVDGAPFNMNANAADAVAAILAPYPLTLAAFNSLRTKPGTINQAEFGGAVTIDDINAIL